ncbi:hypothetical protein [Sodalis-like endosymbiont of Proechinophthirus fluctus]|nr:hypothetical protein [Sodalis-like endosymbiont of Proechinophthirus fluctus]
MNADYRFLPYAMGTLESLALWARSEKTRLCLSRIDVVDRPPPAA